jgi:hypothetical protein
MWTIPSLAPNTEIELKLAYRTNITNPVDTPSVFGFTAKVDCTLTLDGNNANNKASTIYSYEFVRDRGGESIRKLLRRLRARGIPPDEFEVAPSDYNGDGVLDAADVVAITGFEAAMEIEPE